MKRLKQFRYYGPNDPRNFPTYADYYNRLIGNNIFSETSSISHLGIQAMPGTIFYLNNDFNNAISIGTTGIYELDLENLGLIFSIRFQKESIDLLTNTGTNINDRILIDIIYEGEEDK